MSEKLPTTISPLGSTADPTSGEAASESRPPRKVPLENGEFQVGNVAYATPDADVMHAITEETSDKVVYFPSRIPADGKSLLLGDNVRGEPLFSAVTYGPLLGELLQRFSGRPVALRAVMASVNGTLKDVMGEGRDVLDIADVIARGQEQMGSFNVQLMPDHGTDSDAVSDAKFGTKYISSYSSRVGGDLMMCDVEPTDMTPPDFADSIFPAILVYDAAGLQSTGEDRFMATFKGGLMPQDVLLGAYILDRTE